jgi:hypothetical protein
MRYEQAKPLVEKLMNVAVLYHASSMLRSKVFDVIEQELPDLDEGCYERGCICVETFPPKETK